MSIIDNEILGADLTTLAENLDNKSLSAVELIQNNLAAIEQRDTDINSFITFDRAAALEEAKQSDQRRAKGKALSRLDGLSVGIKDNIDVAGFITTAGLNIKNAQPIKVNAPCVEHLRNAGAVVVGKLNLDEGSLGATNHNPHHGDCRNPFQPGLTPGGSSGGCAAAVAAGFTCFALGTDSMGSVRIPAAYCGIAGIKPSRGLVSIRKLVGVSRRLDHVGPLARSPRDLEWILKTIAGFDPCCPQSRRVQLISNEANLIALRFMIPADLNFAGIEQGVQQVFYKTCADLQKAGVRLVEKIMPNYDYGAVRRAGLLVCETEMCIGHKRTLEQHPEVFSEKLRSMLGYPQKKSAIDLAKADECMDQASILCESLLSDVNFVLLPTTPQTPFPLSGSVPNGQADLTAPANMSGYPAISFHMGMSEDNLPVGMQILGRPGTDFMMIKIAQYFSDVLGIRHTIPLGK